MRLTKFRYKCVHSYYFLLVLRVFNRILFQYIRRIEDKGFKLQIFHSSTYMEIESHKHRTVWEKETTIINVLNSTSLRFHMFHICFVYFKCKKEKKETGSFFFSHLLVLNHVVQFGTHSRDHTLENENKKMSHLWEKKSFFSVVF